MNLPVYVAYYKLYEYLLVHIRLIRVPYIIFFLSFDAHCTSFLILEALLMSLLLEQHNGISALTISSKYKSTIRTDVHVIRNLI